METYIFSQILTIIAYIICGIGFLKKEKIHILFYSTLFSILILIQYLLLKAYSGVISCIISIIRNLLFIHHTKRNIQNNKLELLLLCIFTILLTSCIYKSPLDILPMVLALLGIISYWNTNTRLLRIFNILCSICYVLYAIPLKSYVTIVCEMYLIVTSIIGLIKYEK